jgi:hypothetical protein
MAPGTTSIMLVWIGCAAAGRQIRTKAQKAEGVRPTVHAGFLEGSDRLP